MRHQRHTSQRRHHRASCTLDGVRIDEKECQALPKYPKLTPEQRLTVLIAVDIGLSAKSFASLQRLAARAVAEYGSVDKAISVLEDGLGRHCRRRRPADERTLPRP
jgi:hypothetical protein